jgi:hypothetical protein
LRCNPDDRQSPVGLGSASVGRQTAYPDLKPHQPAEPGSVLNLRQFALGASPPDHRPPAYSFWSGVPFALYKNHTKELHQSITKELRDSNAYARGIKVSTADGVLDAE